jgi:seryl-tRNA synthetase
MEKIKLLKEIEFSNNFELVSTKLLEWKKRKPTPELNKLIKAVTDWYVYTFELQTNEGFRNKIIEEYRGDKLRAIERARKSEAKVEDLEKELNKYKIAYG